MENREIGMGWPLGLGSMYMRLRMVERRSALYAPSTSFSSFTSSNLDTETSEVSNFFATPNKNFWPRPCMKSQSTVSFFQDKSKSLGRLIGIRPRNRRPETMYVQISADERSEVHRRRRSERSSSDHHVGVKMCDGICIPMCLSLYRPRKKCTK